jgi:hypothetical protein
MNANNAVQINNGLLAGNGQMVAQGNAGTLQTFQTSGAWSPAAGGTMPASAAPSYASTTPASFGSSAGPMTDMGAQVSGSQMGALETASVGLDASASTGMMGWLEQNPMATMILGQGVMGAAQGYNADKAAKDIADREDEYRKSRGLMGYDSKGQYGGQPQGVVASQQKTNEPTTQAIAPPTVEAPVVPQQVAAAPAPQPTQTPVPREQLPQMNRDGQVARG